MQDTSEHAYLIAEDALGRLRKHMIAPTAQNFAVWQAALAGTQPELMQALLDIEAQKLPLSQERMDFLYATYLGDNKDVLVQETAVAARKLFTEMLLSMQEFMGANREVSQNLGSHVAGLSDSPSIEELKALAGGILQGASQMKHSGDAMQQRLADSQREIDTLRETLSKATAESEKDFLTNLYNRKAFDRILAERMEEARREKTELALLLVDVDHFKTFNDTFGHLIGDEVLKIVARAMTDTVKGADTVARYGGEEFAVILPKTPIGGGMIVGESLRKVIASRELKRRDTGTSYGVVTVSIGVACLRVGADTAESLIARADEALYRSKKAGRNRVTQETFGQSSSGGVVSPEAAARAKAGG